MDQSAGQQPETAPRPVMPSAASYYDRPWLELVLFNVANGIRRKRAATSGDASDGPMLPSEEPAHKNVVRRAPPANGQADGEQSAKSPPVKLLIVLGALLALLAAQSLLFRDKGDPAVATPPADVSAVQTKMLQSLPKASSVDGPQR